MPAPRGRDFEKTREILAAWLRARLPDAADLALSPLHGPAATGFSNDTLLFDASWTQGGRHETRPLVCRIEPTAGAVFPRYDVAAQYRVMRALHGSGVPVPGMLALERDAGVLGAPFFVMERVEGRIPTDVPPYHSGGWMVEATPAERAAIWSSALDALAAIHRCDPVALGIDFLEAPPRGADTVGWQLEHWRRYRAWVARGRPFPTLEAAEAWLRESRPPAASPAASRAELCWGDARIGNMIFRDGRCVAVLDWEMATLGPAEMDLGWFLLLDRHHGEGVGAARLEGFLSREESVARWESRVGRRAEHLAFWEAFAAYRFAAILAGVASQLVHWELAPAESTFAVDNTASRLLAKLLGLPPPGVAA